MTTVRKTRDGYEWHGKLGKLGTVTYLYHPYVKDTVNAACPFVLGWGNEMFARRIEAMRSLIELRQVFGLEVEHDVDELVGLGRCFDERVQQ